MKSSKIIKLPYKLLIYDIETSLMLAYLFGLGEQTIRHPQLFSIFNITNIICISAKWYGEDEIFCFSGENAVEEFDKLARQADVCLGKNSDRFDVLHINTQRMLQGLKPFPEWMDSREDLEKQCRKYFKFPSQSLDYISELFGFGGKQKMEFLDWKTILNHQLISKIHDKSPKGLKATIANVVSKAFFGLSYREVKLLGEIALNKMITYNKKDVLDTEAILIKVLPYVQLKKISCVNNGCIVCGSNKIVRTKVATINKTKYQYFDCLNHKGYAGKCTFGYDRSRNRIFGKMGR